ncbi:MAG: response regulator [Nitrospinales bacterium]
MNTQSILLVDDKDTILQTLKYNLDKNGYSVDTASSEEAGIEKYQAADYDMVITDVMMEEKKSVELLKGIVEIHPEAWVMFLGPWTLQANDLVWAPMIIFKSPVAKSNWFKGQGANFENLAYSMN